MIAKRSPDDALAIKCWPQLRRGLEHEVHVNVIGSTAEEVALYLIIWGLEERRRQREEHVAAADNRFASVRR